MNIPSTGESVWPPTPAPWETVWGGSASGETAGTGQTTAVRGFKSHPPNGFDRPSTQQQEDRVRKFILLAMVLGLLAGCGGSADVRTKANPRVKQDQQIAKQD